MPTLRPAAATASAGSARGLFEPPSWRESWRLSKPSPVLAWALGLSLFVHGGLLAMRIVDPEAFNRVFQDTPLEVVLVNAKTDDLAPAKAQALAQTNLNGGGDAESGRAASPMVAAPFDTLGDNDRDMAQQLENLQEEQQKLLAQLKQEVAAMPVPDPRKRSLTPEQRQMEEQRQRRLKHIAEIEKVIREQNARPRKAFISPSVKRAVYAPYYDLFKSKVEARGTTNFPTQNGKPLYGSLSMSVTLDVQGRVVEMTIDRSSGSRLLDQRAMAITQAGAPYGRFSDELRRRTDLLVITSRFNFTREGLETTLSANGGAETAR